MKLPLFKKLSIEQFRKQADWISHLIYPINSFFYNVTNTINDGLSLKANLKTLSNKKKVTPTTMIHTEQLQARMYSYFLQYISTALVKSLQRSLNFLLGELLDLTLCFLGLFALLDSPDMHC